MEDERRSGPRAVEGLAGTAARLRALPPSCGPVRLVAVDGHAGSGKTTFAGCLARALGGAPVVHLDDLATHDELFAWVDRLLGQVIRPLARGERARHQVYDWVAGRFGGERAVPPAEVLVLDGVGSARRALRPYLAQVLWMDVPGPVARGRGELRDGPGLGEFWERWVREEREHFAADPSLPFADLLVRRVPDGYEVREVRRDAA